MITVGFNDFDATFKGMKRTNRISGKIDYLFYVCIHSLFLQFSLIGCQICGKIFPIPEIKGRIYQPSMGFMIGTNPFLGPSFVHKNCLQKELNKLEYKLIEDESGFHIEDESGNKIFTNTAKHCVCH